jgi:hypothetical protein
MSYNWSNPVDFGSGFGADTQGQFKDITSFLPAKQGGNMLLAPLAAPLITGLFSAGSSMFGANKAEQAAKRSEKLARDNAFNINFQSFLGRQAADAANTNQLAFAIGDRNFSNTLSDLDLRRQKDAALFQGTTLDPIDAANKRDAFRAEIGMRGSAEAKALEQAANRENLKRTLAEKQGAMMGMFGRIAPIDTSTLFV